MIGLLASAKACINHVAAETAGLDGRRRSGQIVRMGRTMEGKARFVFPILATGVVVLVASCAVTYVNIGLRVDFVRRWLCAFLVGWPVAAVTAYLAFPAVRSATVRLTHLIEGR